MLTLGCPDLLGTVYHQSLIPILGDRNMADIPNQRLYRFKEKCLMFMFNIQYLPGKINHTPDCISSRVVLIQENLEIAKRMGRSHCDTQK